MTYLVSVIAAVITANISSKMKQVSMQASLNAYQAQVLLNASELLQRADGGEQIARILEVPDPDIYQAAVFGAYIKRRANLALLAEREPVMDITELTLSVQEVLDYVMIRPECAGSVYQASGGYESSDILCGAFELFGSLVEASLSYIPSILVQIEAVYGFQMKVIIDAPTMTIPEDQAKAIWQAHGMETIVSREEDAVIVTLKERRAAS